MVIFIGIKILPIADAITISFAAPIFATIFSILFLKEIVRFYRWFAIIIGVIGLLIVLKPGTGMFSYYSFFHIILYWICNNIYFNKKLSKTDPDYLISMYFTIVLILTGGVSYFLVGMK